MVILREEERIFRTSGSNSISSITCCRIGGKPGECLAAVLHLDAQKGYSNSGHLLDIVRTITMTYILRCEKIMSPQRFATKFADPLSRLQNLDLWQ